MQLFSSGAAQAYANSFRPWRPTGGFKDVKSDVGKKLFKDITDMNFRGELEMATRGLMEYSGTLRQKMVNDAALKRTEIMYNRDEEGQKMNKKAALARLLGGGRSAIANPITNRGSSGTATSLFGGLVNPLDATIQDGRRFQAIEGMVNADLADSAAAAKDLLGLGKTVPERQAPSGLQVPSTGSAATLQTPQLSSLKLDEKVLEEELEGIFKEIGATKE